MTDTAHRLAKKPQKAPLHDYQRDMVNFILDHPKCGLFLPIGSGKACDDNTIIPTPFGDKRLGDILPGDYIFSSDGTPTKVIAVYHHQNKKAFKITLRDGRNFICCDEHIIPYHTYKNPHRLRTAQLKDMLNDWKQGKPGAYAYKYRIPNAKCVQYPKQQHVIHPYLLGVLLGNGALHETSISISSIDEDVIRRAAIMQGIPQKNVHKLKANNHAWQMTKHPKCDAVRHELIRLHLKNCTSRTKFIPNEYLEDSQENRFELLCGLLDTDGSIQVSHAHDTSNSKHGVTFKYSTINKQLATDCTKLARSLGYAARLYEHNRQTKPTEYTVTIYTHDTPMTCKRKLQNDSHIRTTRLDYDVPIINIEEVTSRDMTCLTVDAPDHCFLINDYIVTHNTLTTLEAIWELDPMCHILLIGPKPVIRSTWADEMDNFNFPFRVESLVDNDRGKKLSPQARHDKYKSVFKTHSATIWLINREMIVDLVENLPKDKKGKPIWPFKMVVIDEVQSFKSYNSKRFKALKSVTPQIGRLIELTGTPSPNGLQDIWPLIYLIDEGQRLGPNITSYRNRWFYSTMTSSTGAPIGFKPRYGAEKEIHDLIKDVVVSLPDVATKMPALIMDDHKIQLSANERSLYKELAKESLLEFTNGDEVIAPNAAVLVAKLSQLASGAIYINGTAKYRKIHERKLEETWKIIEAAGSPVIVAYHFKSDKEMLLAYLRERIDNVKTPLPQSDPTSSVRVYDGSPEMVREWNAGKIPVLMIQPASAGAGLNLQKGGHTLIWYTLPWSLEHYIQTNGRIYRQGQTETTFIHRLMVTGTVDKRICNALEDKDTSQSALMKAVRLTKDDLDI